MIMTQSTQTFLENFKLRGGTCDLLVVVALHKGNQKKVELHPTSDNDIAKMLTESNMYFVADKVLEKNKNDNNNNNNNKPNWTKLR